MREGLAQLQVLQTLEVFLNIHIPVDDIACEQRRVVFRLRPPRIIRPLRSVWHGGMGQRDLRPNLQPRRRPFLLLAHQLGPLGPVRLAQTIWRRKLLDRPGSRASSPPLSISPSPTLRRAGGSAGASPATAPLHLII